MTKIKIGLLLLGSFMIRPTALGQSLTTVGIGFFLAALLLHLIEAAVEGRAVLISRQQGVVLALSLLLWGYLLGHATLVGSIHLDSVIKAFTTHLLVLVAGAVVLSDPAVNTKYFRGLVYVMCIAAVSYTVTMFLTLFVPLERLFLFQVPIEGYVRENLVFYSGSTFFPLTTLYGFHLFGGLQLPRLLGWFRESGIYQAFAIWGYFSLRPLGLDRPWVKVSLVMGLIASLSTSGIVLFPVTATLYYLLAAPRVAKKHSTPVRVMALIVAIVTPVVAYYAPVIGLRDKAATYTLSFSDRFGAAASSLELLAQNPLGIGMYGSTVANAGINFIGDGHMIGILGMLLVLLVYFAPMAWIHDRRGYFVALVPLMVTYFVAQPLLDAPLVYLMLMANRRMYNTNTEADLAA